MLKVVEIKQILDDGDLIEKMYLIKELVNKIIKKLENNTELDYDEYNFINTVLAKVKRALQKTDNVLDVKEV